MKEGHPSRWMPLSFTPNLPRGIFASFMRRGLNPPNPPLRKGGFSCRYTWSTGLFRDRLWRGRTDRTLADRPGDLLQGSVYLLFSRVSAHREAQGAHGVFHGHPHGF